MIRSQLAAAIAAALESARAQGELALDEIPGVTLEIPKSRNHGDWATSIALALPRKSGQTAVDIATIVISHLPVGSDLIEKAEVAGPGFINITLPKRWRADLLRQIVSTHAGITEAFGRSTDGGGQRVLVEFVSTNPNGPITVAGGRNAAIGDAIASLLTATGYDVTREYYVNDAPNSLQMVNFGKSVLLRYRQLLRRAPLDNGADPPDWLYQGDYVSDIARNIVAEHGTEFEDADPDDSQTIQMFRELAEEGMIASQKADLDAFGVEFDSWFHEANLHADGRVKAAIDQLTERGYTFEHEGALWLRSTAFGDDKDRVLVRANGTPTYIAGDVAYHKAKFDRGFDLAIDVWGADHAGYIARTKASVAELGYDPNRLEIVLYQLVRILKDGEFVKASKRKGDVLELKADLIDEIGKDAARFFYLTRSPNTELDIDLDLAKKNERDNPVYYVQYAHARLVKALDRARETDPPAFDEQAGADLDRLTQESEIDLIRKLAEYPDEVLTAARDRAPQRITQFLRDLAALFHTFYDGGNRNADLRIACADRETMKARIVLAEATRVVLRNALALVGVSAPDRM